MPTEHRKTTASRALVIGVQVDPNKVYFNIDLCWAKVLTSEDALAYKTRYCCPGDLATPF